LLTEFATTQARTKGMFQMYHLSIVAAVFSLLAASACTTAQSKRTDGGVEDNADVSERPGEDVEDSPDSGATNATEPKNALTFVPSNVPAVVADGMRAMNIFGRCIFDTDAGTTTCGYENFRYQTIAQNDSDQTEVGVFVTGSLNVGPDATVSVMGSRPLVIVTSGDIFVSGIIEATPAGFEMRYGNGGGFSSPVSSSASHSGKGPGGGGAPTGTSGGGGGGYCGKGGGTTGGMAYGNAAISPLLGGSSGALGDSWAGAGGGAIQLVSATSITLTSLAKINVGGGGGEWEGNGGGSGGAILLEAPVVTMGGTLAANGGGGGGNALDIEASGSCGMPNSSAAPGGTSTPNVNPGGNGSAGLLIDGSAGTYTEYIEALGDYGGGSGGGAGRIRINTTTGQATVTGVLSPASTTTCVSQGKLKAK
jgi:hypothetical protein